MIEVRQTEVYARWFARLRDIRARARIDARIRRLSLGNHGDVPRVDMLVTLLCGGDKALQHRDIRRARAVAKELED